MKPIVLALVLACSAMNWAFATDHSPKRTAVEGEISFAVAQEYVCAGQMTSLNYTGENATSVIWEITNMASNATEIVDGQDVEVLLDGSGMYSLTIHADIDGVTLTQAFENALDVKPTPDIFMAANVTSLCRGGAVMLFAEGAESFVWDEDVAGETWFFPTETRTYNVAGVNQFGCIGTAQIEIEVLQLPFVSAEVSASSVCAGDEITLNSSGDAVEYDWINPGVESDVSFTINNSTNFVLVGIGENGCSKTDDISVNVISNPILNDENIPTVACTGTELTLEFSQPGVTYTWDNDVQNGVPFQASEPTTYTVEASTPQGCNTTASFFIDISEGEPMTVQVSGNVVCAGEPVTLTVIEDNNILWNGEIANGETFVPLVSGTYTAEHTDPNSCLAPVSVEIVVHPTPELDLTPLPELICTGDMVALNATSLDNIVWSHGQENGAAILIDAPMTLAVSATNTAGCVRTETLEIIPATTPTIDISLSDETPCVGDEFSIDADSDFDFNWNHDFELGSTFIIENDFSFIFEAISDQGCVRQVAFDIVPGITPEIELNIPEGAICQGETITLPTEGAEYFEWNIELDESGSYSANQSTTVSYTAYNVPACAVSGEFDLEVVPVNTDFILQNATLIAANENADAYQWYICGEDGLTPISGATGPTHNVTTLHNFALEIIQNGCSRISDCTQYVISGVEELYALETNLYPNPTHGLSTIDFGAPKQQVDIIVADAVGKIVWNQAYQMTEKIEIDLSDFSAGMYYVKIQADGQATTHKLQKMD